jgi:hypothetical protein
MLRNYFKIAFRNLSRNKIATFINIGGLSVGIAVAILTGLWLFDELSFNKYHENYQRIARVALKGINPRGGFYMTSTITYPLANELKLNYNSQFKRLVRSSWVHECILAAGDKKISATGQYMEEEAPDLFSLKMVRGSRSGLKDPHSILLAASVARAIFGSTDPINQPLLINNTTSVKVTGVYEDLPLNTDLYKIKFISTFALWLSQNDWIEKRAMNDWTNHFMRTFVEIRQGSDFESISKMIENVEMEHIKNVDDQNYRELAALKPKVLLDPMPKWHLQGMDRRGNPDPSTMRMVWLVSLIGSFVLLLACINFMNLSTARSEGRAREVGIRKTVGSLRRQLIGQFFSESLVIVMFSFLIAIGLTMLVLGWFNQLAGKQMNIPWTNPFFWMSSLLFIIITGLIAGSYPALYLSSFNPIKALKGNARLGHASIIPRKVLVIFQFTISVMLINCTIIVLRQVHHAKDRPLGYDQQGLVMINMKSDDFYGKYDLLRTEFLHSGVVTDFAESMGKPTEIASGNGGFDWERMDPKKDQNYGTLAVSTDYGKTVGWKFLKGRDFSREYPTDSLGMIINESAMKEMDLKNPLGLQVTWTWWMDRTKIFKYHIIGVVKDMVMESPYEPAKPVIFYQKGHNGGVSWMLIKVKPTVAMSQALPKLEAVMKKLIPSAPFDYQFADQDYAMKFSSEVRISKLAGFFATLAIFISCLGLFGLASFTAEQRTKEIGVRKVLGASAAQVWRLLSSEFMILVLISLMIGIPVSYYFMHLWIENFQYRAALPPWIFGLAGAGALLIALITVSFQAIRAATANPVKSLRSE